MLIPTRRRTWGPQGHAPIVRYTCKHDRLSTIVALTVSAVRKRMGIYLHFQPDNFKSVHVAAFLRHLLAHLRGPIVLLWDSGRAHTGPTIRELFAANPRLHAEPFPKYAPELNPAEQVWNNFKGRTANCLYETTKQVGIHLRSNKRRVSRSQSTLRSFVLSSELPSPPW